jgi:long-chain acyl-CoA synthetase
MTLGNLLQARSIETPGKAVLLSAGCSLSYAELQESSTRLARWLVRQGLEPGDRVALHWSNAPEAVQLYFAVFKAGLIAVPVSPRETAEEIASILKHSQAALCFSEPTLALASMQAAEECHFLRRVLTEIPTEDLAAPLPEVRFGQPAAIFYGPSNSRPKGATHTHRTLLESARIMAADHLVATDTVLAGTSLMDIYGLCASLLPAIFAGATTAVPADPDPAGMLDAVELHHCTCVTAPSPLMMLLAEEQAHKPRQTSSLRLAIAGGDSVPPGLRRSFEKQFGVILREGCAMTETCPIVIDLTRVPAGVEIRIVDRNQNQDVREGEIGDIIVHSPANCVSFWKDDAATRSLFARGWLHTRDLGHRTPGGCYWFRCHTLRTARKAAARYMPIGYSADIPSGYYAATR